MDKVREQLFEALLFARELCVEYHLDEYGERFNSPMINKAIAAHEASKGAQKEETDQSIAADAYMHAMGELEKWWKSRAKRGAIPHATEGSLCDGIGWICSRVDYLEADQYSRHAPEQEGEYPSPIALSQ